MNYALILAGGIGSRFWPFSRELEPKQFLKIIGEKSLLQNTIGRLKSVIDAKNIFIITNKAHYYELKKQVFSFSLPEENIILEPKGKNTAPAIGLFASLINKKDKNANFIVMPSDHYIKDEKKFRADLLKALKIAQNNHLVTIGIKPRKAATGYGYIKINPKSKIQNPKQYYFEVEKFLEKPSIEKAKKYAASKNYYWNSGIFIWKAAVILKEIKKYLPELSRQMAYINNKDDIAGIWGKIKPISIDYGIMEHSKKICLIPANFNWTDLGSWEALEEVLPKDTDNNILQADTINHDSKDICIFSRAKRLICTVGLKNLIIADTPDALLICDKTRSQEVKHIVDKLKSSKRTENITHITEKRPWGMYTVLQENNGFKIKIIEVEPKKRLSLQRHKNRAEHWVVVSGTAKVTFGKKTKLVNSNQSIYIPKTVKHRIENPYSAPLKIVEVQTGKYLGENDIERFEDDFNR